MDIEKTMQFILDMQAKHEVAMQKHEEAIRQHDEVIRQWDERFLRFQQETGQRFTTLVDVCMSLTRSVEETNSSVRELREAQRSFVESQAHTDRRLDAVIDIAQGTERRLGELAKIVDKLVKRNGSRE